MDSMRTVKSASAKRTRRALAVVAALAVGGAACGSGGGPRSTVAAGRAASAPHTPGVHTPAGVRTPGGIYAAAGPGDVRPPASQAVPRVYVPNSRSDTVSVIDPATFRVIRTLTVGRSPQHVVPSWDLRTLWVDDNGANALTPIDPQTGEAGRAVPVDDPYNLYFTLDGAHAIVVAEGRNRLDFRDPHTMALEAIVPVPCKGPNHLDFSPDGSYLVVSCEFSGTLVKLDVATRRVTATRQLPNPAAMPQDVRLAPDGSLFLVADMGAGGVWYVSGTDLAPVGFVPTGTGAHGLYPSRDGRSFYVTNRGSARPSGPPHGPGSVSVLDVAQRRVTATWPIPGGGSPDMGNVSADGRQLWIAGRYDGEVYVFDTTTGALAARIPVGPGPHGLTIWPQPGRFSLGHTGNMR